MSTEQETLPDFVRRVAHEKNLPFREVARRSGLSSPSISDIVSGKTREVKASTLTALAKGLDVSEEELFRVYRGKSATTPTIEHQRLIEMYEDIPRQCQQDVLDLLAVLQKNHSISARREQRSGRRVAAAAASGLREAGQVSSQEDRSRNGKRPVEVEPEADEDVPQAGSPFSNEAGEHDQADEVASPPERRRANGN